MNSTYLLRDAKIDYAANGGTYEPNPVNVSGPTSLLTLQQAQSYRQPGSSPGHWGNQYDFGSFTGIVHQMSAVRMADVSDGTSYTLAVAEKYLVPESYETSQSEGDDEGEFFGYTWDTVRLVTQQGSLTAVLPPMQDTPGYDAPRSFGSAHANGFNAAMCDGSVETLSYNIDPTIFWRLGNRRDGLAISGGAF